MANTRVIFETSLGKIVIELDDEKAPLSAKNFADYAKEGFLITPYSIVSFLDS
ncbi:hypothetical protein MASR2M78_10700 [Treponema sp.]